MGPIQKSEDRAAFERLSQRKLVLGSDGVPAPPQPEPRASLPKSGGAVFVGLGAEVGPGVVATGTADPAPTVIEFPTQDPRDGYAGFQNEASLARTIAEKAVWFLQSGGSLPLELSVWELLADSAPDLATEPAFQTGPDPDPPYLGLGQTATVEFWRSAAGRSLLLEFNGGADATDLANWLAATLPHLHGPGSASDMTGKTNLYVASRFRTLAATSPPSADAQVFATALAVYATCASLGGHSAAQHGFRVGTYGVGASCCNVGSAGAALGVCNGSTLTILQILQAVDRASTHGSLLNDQISLVNQVARLFSLINEFGDIHA